MPHSLTWASTVSKAASRTNRTQNLEDDAGIHINRLRRIQWPPHVREMEAFLTLETFKGIISRSDVSPHFISAVDDIPA